MNVLRLMMADLAVLHLVLELAQGEGHGDLTLTDAREEDRHFRAAGSGLCLDF